MPKKKLKAESFLIFMPKGLGNSIMFIPFLNELKKSYNDSKIYGLFIGKPFYINFLNEQNIFNEIIVLNDRKYLLKEIRKIRGLKFNYIIAKFNSHRFEQILITLLSGIKKKIGHVTSGGWKGRIDFLFNLPVKMQTNQHEIDRNNLLGIPLNIKNITKLPSLIIPKNVNPPIVKSMDGKYITIHPFTSENQSFKSWPEEYWIKFIQSLINSEINFLILGSEYDKTTNLYDYIMKNNPNFSMIGDLSTGEMAELICRSKVLVCNDSGPMHVAVGVGTRVVAIYGSQDYTRSYPRGEKDVVLRKDKTLHMHVNTLNNFKYDNNPNISKTYQYFIKPKELYSITNFIYDRPDDIVPKWLSENIINYK